MKRIAMLAVVIFCMAGTVSAQNKLGNILSKVTQMAGTLKNGSSSDDSNTTGGSIIESITDLLKGKSSVSAETMVGNWGFTGSAVSFKSQNALSNLASSVAQSTIEKKLDTYLKKVGITEGLFSFVFNADSTMAVNYGSRVFKGTWTYDPEAKTIKMKVANFVNMTGFVAMSGNKMELLFDTTTLMNVVKSVTSVYKNSTLAAISKILYQYDEMYAGFRLELQK